jgi:hypothetical protein
MHLTENHCTKEAGYYFSPNATLLVTPEIMNEPSYSRPVIVNITYEFIAASHYASKFHHVTPIGLDVSGICGDSDVSVTIDPAANISLSAFYLTLTPAWAANITSESPSRRGISTTVGSSLR